MYQLSNKDQILRDLEFVIRDFNGVALQIDEELEEVSEAESIKVIKDKMAELFESIAENG